MEVCCVEPGEHDLDVRNCIYKVASAAKLKGPSCSHDVMVKWVSRSCQVPMGHESKIERLKTASRVLDHVCRFYGIRVVPEKGIFFVMDKYPMSLKTKLGQGKLKMEEIQRIGSDIIRGVNELHAAGIICMYMKPSNVLLDDRGRAYISDYGLALLESDIVSLESKFSELSIETDRPKHGYAPPEMWGDFTDRSISKASDSWSFGCILLEMCSNTYLWDGLDENQVHLYIKEKMLPRSLNSLVEGPLLEIIENCLQFEVEKRFEFTVIHQKFLQHVVDGDMKLLPLGEPLNPPTKEKESHLFEDQDDQDDYEFNYDEEVDHSSGEEVINEKALLACQQGSSKHLEESAKVIIEKALLAFQEGFSKHLEEELAEELARAGIDPNMCLRVALNSWHGNERVIIVKLLLNAGADCNGQYDGQSALHVAALQSDSDLLKVLIDVGADVNIRNNHNGTPLQIALKNGACECVKLLLNTDADYCLQDNDEENAFHVAAQAALRFPENLNAISEMLTRPITPVDVNVKNYRGETLEILLKRLPKKWISQTFQKHLKDKGIDLHVERPEVVEESQVLDDSEYDLKDAKDAGLVDADMAGRNPESCTLIITEGDTAKRFAEAGTSSQRDKYGIYPLHGKIKNVVAVHLVKNKHVRNIFSALGLKAPTEKVSKKDAEKYEFDFKRLRYHSVLMMTDQDVDGAHIKGLLINMFFCLCPELLKLPRFLQDFNTILYKAKHVETGKIVSFSSKNDYRTWFAGEDQSKWKIQTLKGLGSNEKEDISSYFQNMEKHTRYFVWSGAIDGSYLKRSFQPNSSSDRKQWIQEYQGHKPSQTSGILTCGDFVKKDLIPFFIENNRRSIPSLMDGLKPSQRKIMFFLLEKVTDTEYEKSWDITELASCVKSSSEYDHSVKNLQLAIMGMADTGTYNVNLIEAKSLMSSREDKRRVSADQSRYYRVSTSPIAQHIFKKEDYKLLTPTKEKGKFIEPEWYAPILPLVLINGAIGVGSGYKTEIPRFNPKDIIKNIKRLMDGEEVEEMLPWYPNFEGHSKKNAKENSYTVYARWNLDGTTVKIKDILPMYSYRAYEGVLETAKKQHIITDYKRIRETHADGRQSQRSSFEVMLSEAMGKKTLVSSLKLATKITPCIYLFNEAGTLQYYSSPEKVLRDFYEVRLKLYEKREEVGLHGMLAKELWKTDIDSLEKELDKIRLDDMLGSEEQTDALEEELDG